MSKASEGVYESFFTSGQRQFEIHYSEGMLHGVMRRWTAEGQLILEKEFVEDRMEGRSRRWYFSGMLMEDCVYKSDKLHGPYIQYDEEGKVIMRANFHEGEIVEGSLKSS